MAKRRAPNMTLMRLRQEAVPEDRDSLTLTRAPAPAPAGTRHRSRFARTLDELRERCGDAGAWAVLEARYDAIIVWFMRDGPALAHPYEVASTSVALCQEEARYDAGLPRPEGYYSVLPVMRRISPESRDEARRVTADTVRQWEGAGMPHLTPDLITRSHQYILACQRAKLSENAA